MAQAGPRQSAETRGEKMSHAVRPNFLFRSDRLRRPAKYGILVNPLRREQQENEPEPPPAWTWRRVCSVLGPPTT
jgi:hypothetical protein